MAPTSRLPGPATSHIRHNTKYTPFSIPKLLTTVFAITASCSAFVLDPSSRHIRSLGQSGVEVPGDRVKNADIHARAIAGRDTSSTTTASRAHTQTTVTASKSTATTTTSTTTSAAASTEAGYTGLPQPFDTALSSNFSTKTCPTLFNKIIYDPAVSSCVPVSMLIQGSRSFYEVESSETGLSKTMQISCNAISSQCNELFQSYAATVASPNGCKTELSEDNSRVQQLFLGLISYLPIYNAACLRVSSTSVSTSTNASEYCLTDAIENTANPADLSLYTLPLGQSLSGSPTCSSCTKQAMSIFANAARNLTSPLSTSYLGAASTINSACGANFVNATFTPIPGSDSLSAAWSLGPGSSWTTALLMTAALTILL